MSSKTLPPSHTRSSTFEYDVFLSHNSADKPVVRELAERLRGDGLKVWLDEWVIRPGDSIPLAISRGLENSRTLLMALSANFNESEWATYEHLTFLFRDPTNKRRRFIPLRLDDSEPKDSLRQFAFVDWRERQESEYQRLIEACRPEQIDKPGERTKPRPEATPRPPAPIQSLGHTEGVRAVDVSADGRVAVTGCNDGVVRVWDLEKNVCLATLEGHSGYVYGVAITPDATHAVSGAADDTVRLWDLLGNACLATLEGHSGEVNSVAITPDATRAVSGADDKTVRLWDLQNNACLTTLEGHSGSVLGVTITPDATRAVSGASDNTIRLWDLVGNACLATLEGHSSAVNSVAITPDATRAVSGAYDNAVRLWDLVGTACLATLEGHSGSVYSVAITPDATRAVSGADDKTVRLWDLVGNACLATLEGHSGSVLGVAITPDAARAVSGAGDNTVRLWDLETQSCLEILEGHFGIVRGVAVTPDATRAVSGSVDNTVRLWDLRNKSCIATFEGHGWPIRCVAITPDATRAVSGADDDTVRVWDLENQSCLATLEGHSGFALGVAITPDATRAVSGAGDGNVRLWDLENNACLATLKGHSGNVLGVAITPDATRAISGATDKSVRVWDLVGNACLATLEGHSGIVNSVAITPDATRAVSGACDNTVRVWDLVGNACLATLEGHTDYVRSVAITPDATRAVSGANDNTVRVWDLENKACLATLEGHTRGIRSVAITPDATQDIMSAAYNGVVRLWSLADVATADTRPRAARYTNAKVLLIGDSRVGKTGLAMRLADDHWEPTESTDGHWATRLGVVKHEDERWATRLQLSDAVDADGVRREIWLWDFAGQADYRLIHQLFMDQTALAVLVFDPQSDTVFESLGRWDHDIRRAARREFAKLLVAARCDVGGLRCSRADLDQFQQSRGFADYIETSAKNKVHCDTLLQAIGDNIDWKSIPVTGSNETFDQLKTEILRLRDEGTVLARTGDLNQRLQLTLPNIRFTLDELITVVDLLAAPGLVWRLDFGEFVLLQPEQINSYAAAVIRRLRSAENELGIIPEDDVVQGRLKFDGMQRLPKADEEIVLRAMHQTFVDYGLCLRQDTGQGTQLVFPAFFGVERPEHPGMPPVFVTYRFAGNLDEIYATLVVRLHHTPAFEKGKLWRFAADFRSQTGAGMGLRLTRQKEGLGEIEVYFETETDDGTKVAFIKYIHEHLLERAEDVQRLRHYLCPKCAYPFKDTELALEIVKEDGEEAEVNCVKPKCRSPIRLWDAIERKFASDEFKRHVRELRELATLAIGNESRELILVGHAFATAGEAGQIFRPVANSDHGIDGEIEFMDWQGNASGRRVYLQLKSGDSYLDERQRDKSEVFRIKKPRWADYWVQQNYDVMLVIRTSDKRIRWMNATQYLTRKKESGQWPAKEIIFDGEDFSPLNILRLRKRLLPPPEDRIAT